MQYITVEGSNYTEFITRVNNKLKKGYILQGGVSYTSDNLTCYYVQAMIKELK